MSHHRVWLLISLTLLLGCAAPRPQPVSLGEPPPPPPPPPVELAAAPPEMEEPLELDAPTIRKAAKQARQGSTRCRFREGMCAMTWRPYGIYKVTLAMGTDTVLAMAPGERVIYFGAADTESWKVDKTFAGDGESKHTIIIVRPKVLGARTTATLTTVLGLYRLEFVSTPDTYIPIVTWKHTARQQAKLEAGIPSETRYQMRLLSARSWPVWTPTRMWDTSKKTYVEVPDAMKYAESPVIYAKLPSGLQRVNHRLLPGGTTFELDKVSARWQVQYGREEDGDIIELERVVP